MAINRACRRLSRDMLLTLSGRPVGVLQPGVHETISQLHLRRWGCRCGVHFVNIHSHHLLHRHSLAVLFPLGKSLL